MRDRIQAIIARECGWLNRAHCLDDPDASLGLDSMDRICLAASLDEEFGIETPDADVEGWCSLNDVLATVARLAGAGVGA